MKPILSIVIPTFNRCNYLKECLKSITECSVDSQKKIEIIICNNFSQDRTELVIKNFIETNTYIKKINVISSKKEIPAQDNWENGINICNSSRVLLLSDDDKVICKGLDKILQEESFLNYDLYIGGHFIIDYQSKLVAKHNNKNRSYIQETLIRDLSLRKIRHKLCSIIWNKNLILDLNVFSFKYPSNGICLDGAIILASSMDDKIFSSTNIISAYRVHPNNDCRDGDTRKFLDGRKVFHQYGHKMIKENKKSYYWFIFWNIYGGIIQAFLSIFRLKELKTATKLLQDTAHLQKSIEKTIKNADFKCLSGLILMSCYFFIKLITFNRKDYE